MANLEISIASWSRFLCVTAFVIVLAVCLALQAASGVLAKQSPELATSLFSANGQATERLAFQTFTDRITDPNETQQAAVAAAPQALSAYRADVLTPRALAILIMAEADNDARRALINAAIRMNRREASLQSLVIQESLAANDYPRSIEALDQLLRVHPELKRDFFPILGQALAQEASIPAFVDMLDGSSGWHEEFLLYSVAQTSLLPSLADLRLQIDVDDETFDRRLVERLVRLGDVQSARRVLSHATGREFEFPGVGAIDWNSDYPPFDWSFVDEPGLRTQLSQDGGELELYARPGKGGVLAARLLSAPQRAFSIRIDHRVAQKEKARDLRLQLTCSGETAPFLDERFGDSPQSIQVSSLGEGCDYIALALVGRAWSGRSPLNAAIRSIEITQ